jgi:hypothetical protein
MAQKTSLTKRLQIDKNNNLIVIATAVAAFITVFSLVASKALLSQSGYQNRIIAAKNTAVTQLTTDITAVDKLNSSYQAFVDLTPNILGGNPTGNGPVDGDNAKLVLDALPASYDFPALVTSLGKILSTEGVTITSISGTDEQLAEGTSASSATPTVVPMPFSIGLSGSYPSLQATIAQLEASIRPMQLQTFDLSANGGGDMTMTITAQTFFQPGKTFQITSKVVK